MSVGLRLLSLAALLAACRGDAPAEDANPDAAPAATAGTTTATASSDCDGVVPAGEVDAWDRDGDGFAAWWRSGSYDATTSPGADCDDDDATVYPGSGC